MARRIALITALLAFVVGTDSALAASRVSGRVSNASYDLVLVGADGRTRQVHPDRSGRFSVRMASTVAQSSSTDFSSQHRHWRHGYHGHRHWSYRHYRPYHRSYGYYAPRSYGYYGGPRYYGGGPGVTFSFGTGGYRGW